MAAARDTLGAAVGVAAELPSQLGAVVIAAAQNAFVQGMQVVATISAVVAVGVAVLVLVALRDIRLNPDASETEPTTDEQEQRERQASREPRATGTPVPEA